MTEVGLEGHFDMDAFIEHVVGIYDSYKYFIFNAGNTISII
jgi:hypothetical protein